METVKGLSGSSIFLELVVWNLGIKKYTCAQIIFSMATFIAIRQCCCLIRNVCEFFEELKHLQSRYQGDYRKALEASFNPGWWSAFGIAILCYIFYEENLLPCLPLLIYIPLILICWLFCWIAGIQDPTNATISEITEQKQLNVAHGLAWSYYVGYLKFVLPALKESVYMFNEENYNILNDPETRRLHILIPLSCRLYSDLNDADENITFVKEIPPLCIDRAGIKGRVFKYNLYRILDEDKRFHFYLFPDSPETEDPCRHLLSREILKHIKQQHSEEFIL
ncbi:hypothetical protein GDO86_005375 [Hymenochirus boettgeri]|uniref:Stimulator of interferon genes protein n=1 Tax=Hymenochirus boettgeri TaxID=247094 RepID=A0A8T2J1N8_9PIPI|nr:hypothetical protein GDO86_005375 [Hymenochirus boettgeri]